MRVHVDGDVVVYRAGYAAEHTLYDVEYGGRVLTFDGAKAYKEHVELNKLGPLDYVLRSRIYVEDESASIYNVRSIVGSIAERLQLDPENLTLYLSGQGNYREGVAKTAPYKGNRDRTKKPVHSAAIKEYMRRTYNVLTSEGQEADDDMAIAHYAMWVRDPDSTCIASIDKDLNQIPGWHYNFVTDTMYEVAESDARRFFWQQVLSGDPTDNIPGIRGVGQAKAAKALADAHCDIDWYNKALALYVQAYGEERAEEVLTEMARLVYIRREPDEWWNPPKEKS